MQTKKRDKRNVYLMGFMCSGKTRVGKLLADRLGWPFIDTDDLIVKEKGISIPEIFRDEGEPAFRKLEKSCISMVTEKSGQVVSLGGGAVIDPDNWEKIVTTGITIALSYPPEILAARLARKTDRPLMDGYDGDEKLKQVVGMLDKRKIYYDRADLVFHINEEVEAERVAEALTGFVRGRL